MNLVRFHYGENNINTGPLKEIPEICVDHFFGDDLNSSMFFLSHAHTDHLVGLETAEFMRRLNQPGIKLYCHPITPILLGSFERYLGGPKEIRKLVEKRKIVPLDVERPTLLKIHRANGSFNVTVTLLSAGHSPGSVMFLFETPKYRILHTGDFRLEVEDLKRMPCLRDENKSPKKIDHLYVDTTFCSRSANVFPNRKNVLKEAIIHIGKWIAHSKTHIVHLSFSAKFAHEYVLLELNKTFRQKIHVAPERKEIYRYIPELFEIVTLDNDSQFHLCKSRDCVEDGQIITVRFSSMWYTRGDQDGHILWRGKNMTICYSMHSSLEEIAETIDYLKPRIVTPLVLPKNSLLSEVQDALKCSTTTEFEFQDYRSSRNIFGDVLSLDTLCPEERDETHLKEEEMDIGNENQIQNNHSEPSDLESSPMKLSQDASSPKRARLNAELKKLWNYKFSPSPSSKGSQSSSSNESSQSSQEVVSETNDIEENQFLQPKPLSTFRKPNPKRNLLETALSSEISSHSSNSVLVIEDPHDDDKKYSNDMTDSQIF